MFKLVMVDLAILLPTLLARCDQVHLVFHSNLSELRQSNYRLIMVKQLNCRLIPQWPGPIATDRSIKLVKQDGNKWCPNSCENYTY
jgi:hypothetical protein